MTLRLTTVTKIVLKALAHAERELTGSEICAKTGVAAGTANRTLRTLEREGAATSRYEEVGVYPGKRRRYYSLTSEGHEAARQALPAGSDASLR